MIVVDASILTDFLLAREPAVDPVLEQTAGREYEPLHAPELIDPETLNTLRRLRAAGRVTDARADEAAVALDQDRVLRHSHAPLRKRVWQLRDELSAYDAVHLVLADALYARVLLTAEEGLAVRGRARLGGDRVHMVAAR